MIRENNNLALLHAQLRDEIPVCAASEGVDAQGLNSKHSETQAL